METLRWFGVGEGTGEGKRRSATYLSLIAFVLMAIALSDSVPMISGESRFGAAAARGLGASRSPPPRSPFLPSL